MAIPREKTRLTEEQYLAIERAAEFKSEFHDGEMYAMSGGSYEHSLIIANVIRELGQVLKGKTCRVVDSNLRLKIPSSGLYTYPDAMVICGPPEFADGHRDMVLNPAVIVEVLSPSSEAYDRGRKFQDYRTIPSLKEYVLISQTGAAVDVFSRSAEGRWMFASFLGFDSTVNLESLMIALKLREIYAEVDLHSTDSVPTQDPIREDLRAQSAAPL